MICFIFFSRITHRYTGTQALSVIKLFLLLFVHSFLLCLVLATDKGDRDNGRFHYRTKEREGKREREKKSLSYLTERT